MIEPWYCIIYNVYLGDVASSEMIRVLEPFRFFRTTEDGQKFIKFAKEKVTYYNPRAGYGYYEFSEPGYVLSNRNIIALKEVIYHNNIICMNKIIRHVRAMTYNILVSCPLKCYLTMRAGG